MARGVMPPPDLAACAHEFRACAATIADAATAFRATMRQTWTLEDLAERFHGLTRDQLLALLRTHCGYVGAAGQRTVIHLRQVLVLDRVLETQLGGA